MMKTLFGLILSLLLPTFVWAESFVIDRYDVDVTIQSNGNLAITETLDVTFSEPKHGIERKLPQYYVYSDTQDEYIDYSDIISNATLSTYSQGADLVIRLGNADTKVTGSQRYTISYRTSPGIKQYSGYQELYLNLIGTQRDTTITQANFSITVPDSINLIQLNDEDVVVVRGQYGSTGSVDRLIGPQSIIGQVSNLDTNEGVTIGIKFADDSFTNLTSPQYVDATSYEDDSMTLIEKIIAVIMQFGIFFLFGFVGLYKRYLSHQKNKRAGTIVTQYYPPKGITPAVAGYIDNDKFDARDFMATLYDWGARGYLTISQVTESKMFGDKHHITYHKAKTPSDLINYEQIIWNKMFDGADSFDFAKLDQSIWVNEEEQFFDTIKGAIENESQAYYTTTSFGMQKITDQGIKIFAHLRGYREFIEHVEQDKLKEFLKQDPLFIDKLLPWAIIFGLESNLLTQLEGLDRNRPTRYAGNTVFNAIILNDLLTNSTQVINQSFKSAYPRSSSGFGGGGGISVGGGGGGGGGGSW